MTNNISNRNLDELLRNIQAIIIDWVKYAEAKNAVTLAFSGAAITAIVTYLSARDSMFISLRIGLITSTFLIGISMTFNVISFLPKTDSDKYFWTLFHKSKNMKIAPDNDNFYFYGDLKKYVDLKDKKPNPEKLLNAINQEYYQDTLVSFTKEERDLCIQIIINSDIAFQKFTLSGWSVKFTVGAIIATPVCLILNLIISHSL